MAVGEVGPGTKWRRVESSRRKTTAIDPRRARSSHSLSLFPALVRRVWTMALKSQTLRHYTREILILRRAAITDPRERDARDLQRLEKHSPSHGPARRAMSPAMLLGSRFSSPGTRSASNPPARARLRRAHSPNKGDIKQSNITAMESKKCITAWMSRPGVRLVRCPFQQWRSSTPFSTAAADRRWRAQAFTEPRPGARKREKQENGAHARRTEIRYCDVIENSWRGRIMIGVKMVAASFSTALPRGCPPAIVEGIRSPRVLGRGTKTR